MEGFTIMTHDEQKPALKPCPFCGYPAKESTSLHKRDTARVVCTNGECLVSIDADELWQDFSHAAAKWNTRIATTREAELLAVIRAMDEALAECEIWNDGSEQQRRAVILKVEARRLAKQVV
jgi:hypothetical protein